MADDYLNDGWTANRAIEILESRKGKDEPFFLAVGFLKPHLPFVAPKKYWDLYDPAKLPVAESSDPPKDAPTFAPQFGGELRAYHDIPKTGPVPKETARKLVHGYYAAVSYMDAQVGRRARRARRLRASPTTRSSILWGDHGWHLGDHGMWCKHTNYEKATRAALRDERAGPEGRGQDDRRAGRVRGHLPDAGRAVRAAEARRRGGAQLRAAAGRPEEAVEGGRVQPVPARRQGTGPLMGYAIRTDRYRYVEWRKRDGTEVVARELYDHQTDPDEDRNVAGDAGEQGGRRAAGEATRGRVERERPAEVTGGHLDAVDDLICRCSLASAAPGRGRRRRRGRTSSSS